MSSASLRYLRLCVDSSHGTIRLPYLYFVSDESCPERTRTDVFDFAGMVRLW